MTALLQNPWSPFSPQLPWCMYQQHLPVKHPLHCETFCSFSFQDTTLEFPPLFLFFADSPSLISYLFILPLLKETRSKPQSLILMPFSFLSYHSLGDLIQYHDSKYYVLMLERLGGSVKRPTLDFCSGCDLKVMGSNPTLDSVLSTVYLGFSLFLSPSPVGMCAHSLSL